MENGSVAAIKPPGVTKITFLVMMGVAGCGKSTLGIAVAQALGWSFIEGDDLHPAKNIAKMAGGTPLNDDDRATWLASLREKMDTYRQIGQPAVVACSALKQKYRDMLDGPDLLYVYLRGSKATIRKRLDARAGHFMGPDMLQSQFDILEEPTGALVLDIEKNPQQLIGEILMAIELPNYQVGMVGLGVMGRNLAQNLQNHGWSVIGFDPAIDQAIVPTLRLASSPAELVASLQTPRKVFVMVPAGESVDEAIKGLLPALSAGDVIIDGGNTHFKDTQRRTEELSKQGILLIGSGVSGGESGALHGPSLMPGGNPNAWPLVQGMFESVAAKTSHGEACVSWMGKGGAGHYVKMVHNAIEYAMMQLTAEIYDLLHRGLGTNNTQVAAAFKQWNQGRLHGYLIELTAQVLTKQDPFTGGHLVDVIADQAAQKGTGKWASQDALDLAVAVPILNAGVEARILSANRELRGMLAKAYPNTTSSSSYSPTLDQIEEALYAAFLLAYAQGMEQIRAASSEYGWEINLANAVSVWRAGCIIRADILELLVQALQQPQSDRHLLLAPIIQSTLNSCSSSLRAVVSGGIECSIPMPAFASAIASFDSVRSATLPANLIQAQRDAFGAHTYQRVDIPGTFHSEW